MFELNVVDTFVFLGYFGNICLIQDVFDFIINVGTILFFFVCHLSITNAYLARKMFFFEYVLCTTSGQRGAT